MQPHPPRRMVVWTSPPQWVILEIQFEQFRHLGLESIGEFSKVVQTAQINHKTHAVPTVRQTKHTGKPFPQPFISLKDIVGDSRHIQTVINNRVPTRIWPTGRRISFTPIPVNFFRENGLPPPR